MTETSIVNEWFDATQRKEITLVTAGRSGVGKSTLIKKHAEIRR